MKIALITMKASPLRPPGGHFGSGQSVRINALATALAAEGHELTVYMRRDDASVAARLTLENYALAQINAGPSEPLTALPASAWMADFAQQLQAEFRTDRPDIVHAFDWLAGEAALAAAQTGGPPVIATLAPLPKSAAAAERDGQAGVIRRAARIIANCSSHVFTLLDLGARPAAVKLIPTGVDIRCFAPASTAARAGGRFRIATLGGLSVAHGVADVIEAVGELCDVELAVGGGDFEQTDTFADANVARLSALALRRGVADRVTFAGRVAREAAPAFLRAADLVICAQHADSLGLVALEAMACGVPPVVCAVGGLADAVTDGMTGVHVPPRAPRQIAYAVQALLADRTRRERFGRLAIDRAASRCWPRIAAATLDVYRAVVPLTAELVHGR